MGEDKGQEGGKSKAKAASTKSQKDEQDEVRESTRGVIPNSDASLDPALGSRKMLLENAVAEVGGEQWAEIQS